MESLTCYFDQQYVLPKIGAVACSAEEILLGGREQKVIVLFLTSKYCIIYGTVYRFPTEELELEAALASDKEYKASEKVT